MFVLNAHRRLVFFNSGCEQLTGWSATDVLGQVCDFVTETDQDLPAAILSSLAAPAEVWSGQTTTVPVSLARHQLDPLACFVHFFPLTDSHQKVQAALGIIQKELPGTAAHSIPNSLRLHAELAALRHTLKRRFLDDSLICCSPGMSRVQGQLKLCQQSSLPVLLIGEEGSGREYLARIIHGGSQSARGDFIPLDCRRLPADHLRATLRRLTAAHQSDAPPPSTVYFDQIAAVPHDIQRQILELIQSSNPSGPRIIVASTRPLEHFVESDDLLVDLFYALTSVSIIVPPLRSRQDDLQPLAQLFLEELNRDQPTQLTGFHDDVWQQFRRYNWPGNVAELKAVVTEAREECTGPLIETRHLSFGFRTGVTGQSVGPAVRKRAMPLDPLLLRVEREQIELALAEARHNKAKAAELLGITRPRLYRRMDALGIIDREQESTDE